MLSLNLYSTTSPGFLAIPGLPIGELVFISRHCSADAAGPPTRHELLCAGVNGLLIHYYGIKSAQVFEVPGGPNLDGAKLASVPLLLSPSTEHPLRLGLLSKDWWQMGGPLLLQLTEASLWRGIPAVIRAIGPDSAPLPSHPAFEPLGFSNKQPVTAPLVPELSSWHFGILLSDAEASPRFNLGCLHLGIPC